MAPLVWGTVEASAITSARVRLVSNFVANCEPSASLAWAPKEAKAATAGMERKRAVLFMVKLLEIKNGCGVLSNTKAWGPWIQKESTTLTRRDLASAQGLSSLGTDSSAVGRGLVGHHTRTSGFDRAGLGDGGGFSLHFRAGAVGFELGGELRGIGLVSLGTERSESSNSGDGEETCSLVHDG